MQGVGNERTRKETVMRRDGTMGGMKRALAWGTALACFAGACSSGSPSRPAEGSVPQPILVIVGIDGSRSYDFQSQAVKSIPGILDELPPGSRVVAWWISGDSYLPENSIITDTVPEAPVLRADNPFDKRARVARTRNQEDLAAWRKSVVDAVAGKRSPRAEFTDIHGFLLLASERLADWKGVGRVVIFSDLQNNVDRHTRYLQEKMLRGAPVIVGRSSIAIPRSARTRPASL
jgi:hypothetical protein